MGSQSEFSLKYVLVLVKVPQKAGSSIQCTFSKQAWIIHLLQNRNPKKVSTFGNSNKVIKCRRKQ